MSGENAVTFQYERKLSDGHYGSEGFSLSVTYTVADNVLTSEYTLDRAEWLRKVVLASVLVSDRARHEMGPTDEPPNNYDDVSIEDLPF